MNKFLMARLAGQRGVVFQVPGEGAGAVVDPAVAAAAAAAAAAVDAAAVAAAEKAAGEKAVADAAAAKLTEKEAELLREVMDKKSKLATTAAELATTKAALEAYGGVDAAKVAALVKAEADAEKATAEAKGDFDRVKQMMAAEHTKDTATLQAQIDALNASEGAKNKIIDNLTIGNSFGNSVFIRDGLALSPTKARTVYGAHFEVTDGNIVCFDKPAGEAGRTMLVDAAGNALDFDAALKRIVDADPDRKTMLKSNVLPGGSSKTVITTPVVESKSAKTFGVSRIAANLDGL